MALHVSHPPAFPSFALVTVGGPRSEESDRNTTPRGRREARGGGETSTEWCESECGGLKKSIKIVSFLTLNSVKGETELRGEEMPRSDEDAVEKE